MLAKLNTTERRFRSWLDRQPPGQAIGSCIGACDCVLANYFRSQNIGSDIRVTRESLWYDDQRVSLPSWARDLVTALLDLSWKLSAGAQVNPERVREIIK